MRTSLLIIFLLVSLVTNAQFSKGDKVFGGTLSFYTQEGLVNKQIGVLDNRKNFSVTPSFGFFINENFAIGGQLGYSYSLQESSNPSPYKYDSKSFSVGISGQRYFTISDHFLFSILGQFDFVRGVENTPYFDEVAGVLAERQTNSYKLITSIRPNFIFFPSPKWGFNASFGSISYIFSRSLSNGDNANAFSINYGAIEFGVSYYFRKSANN